MGNKAQYWLLASSVLSAMAAIVNTLKTAPKFNINTSVIHFSVTDLMKPDLVSKSVIPSEIFCLLQYLLVFFLGKNP